MTTLQDFLRQQPIRRFDRQETIIYQGEIPQVAYSIKKGYVKGYDISPQGQEQLLWFGGKGETFPMGWVMGLVQETRFFYSAFTECELHVVQRDEFMRFLESNPETLMHLTKNLTARYYDLLDRLRALEQPKATDKIAHTIYFLSQRFVEKNPGNRSEIPLPLTHQDIANLLGLTRETVAVELKLLKDAKLINYDKSRFIVHAKAMREHLDIQ